LLQLETLVCALSIAAYVTGCLRVCRSVHEIAHCDSRLRESLADAISRLWHLLLRTELDLVTFEALLETAEPIISECEEMRQGLLATLPATASAVTCWPSYLEDWSGALPPQWFRHDIPGILRNFGCVAPAAVGVFLELGRTASPDVSHECLTVEGDSRTLSKRLRQLIDTARRRGVFDNCPTRLEIELGSWCQFLAQ
jgi:hypothetical protein